MADPRTSLVLSDDRQKLLDRAIAIVEKDEWDDPPTSAVIDAALKHLIESHRNADDYRDRLQRGETSIAPSEAADLLNTSIMQLRYRTMIESSR